MYMKKKYSFHFQVVRNLECPNPAGHLSQFIKDSLL